MPAPTILTLDQLLTAPTLDEQTIDVPELGGSVTIRAFTKGQQQQVRERATLQHNTRTQKVGDIDTSLLELQMLVEGVIAPPLTRDHIPALRQLPAGVVDRILTAILALSGMTAEAVADAEAAFPDESGAAL